MRIRATITTLAALLATAACGPSIHNAVSDASPANTTVSTTKSLPDNTATWGKRYTWPDGLAVEVAAPVACTPSKSAAGAGARAVKFTITVVNGTKDPVDASLFGMGTEVQVDGRRVGSITDLGGPCGQGFGSGTVLPGKTFAFDMAYPVGSQPGEVQMVFTPHFGTPQAVFVGQA